MTINLNGNLMDLSTPKIMGILNVTPDSFYDGGMFDSNKKILYQNLIIYYQFFQFQSRFEKPHFPLKCIL